MRQLLFFLLLSSCRLFAQQDLGHKMRWYNEQQNQSKLFVHFDRNVYSNYETAWFTGYILEKQDFKLHRVLALSLVRDADSTVVLEDKFLIQDGLSFGNIEMPAKLIEGDYHLVAFTDVTKNGKPVAVFSQRVTIKSMDQPALKAAVKISDTAKSNNQYSKILTTVYTGDGKFLPKPATIYYRYANELLSVKTDPRGQAIINVPYQTKTTNLALKILANTDSLFLNLQIPTPEKIVANVKFYPEGGQLVKGVRSRVGWEVKDFNSMPMAVSAILLKNGLPIDTIETGTEGLGSFYVDGASHLSVRIVNNTIKDILYPLPEPSSKGIVLALQNSLADRFLNASLVSRGIKKINIRIHDFSKTYFNLDVQMKDEKFDVRIPLATLPRGLAAITVLDTLGRPLSERIFFAHYLLAEKLSIKLDSSSYNKRQKVTVTLDLEKGGSNAIVSIACVQASRLSSNNTTDIENFIYLNSEINNLVGGLPLADPNLLEKMLLVRGWRNYSWNGISNQDSIPRAKLDSLRFKLIATKNKIAPGRPVSYALYGGINALSFKVGETGFMEIGMDDLIAKPTKSIHLLNTDLRKDKYETVVLDPFSSIGKWLGVEAIRSKPRLGRQLSDNLDLIIPKNRLLLKEVIIKNQKDNYQSITGKATDWVCDQGVLNCPNHPTGKRPVWGKEYYYLGKRIIYHGGSNEPENPNMIRIGAIHLEKEFYKSDYQNITEDVLESTLYWNYKLPINNGKQETFSFYTGDIIGKFKIVVQGITNSGVVSVTEEFLVK